MPRHVAPHSVSHALAALELHGGNLLQTARALGIPRTTLRRWRDIGSAEATPTQHRDYGELWGQAQVMAVEAAMAMIPRLTEPASDNLRALATLAGIAADKHLDYTQGRRGIVNVSQQQQVIITLQ